MSRVSERNICANCQAHIFETDPDLSTPGNVIWSHLENTRCDDPEPFLIPGVRYRITHRSGMQQRDRVSVMSFLWMDDSNTISWNARPEAGTQQMPRSWIKKMEVVPSNTKVYLNRILHT